MKCLSTILCLLCLPLSLLMAQLAPDFTITATDNATHELYSDYLDNDKTVVLEIMFTTCPPCNDIAPLVEQLNQEWGDGQMDVVFLSLSDKSFDDNSDVAAWEAMHGLSYHGAGQDGGSLTAVAPYKAGTWGPFNGTPTFAVIAPDGTVLYNPRGANMNATIDSIDAAISSTGAEKPQTQFTLGGTLMTESGSPVGNASVTITGQSNSVITGNDGSYQFFPVDLGNTVSVKPSKLIDIRNGMGILDLVLMQRHLLFLETFDSPYQFFAADLNNSKSVNITDLVLMQRVLLFIENDFPNNTSWRFIPEDFVFLNPNNPLLITPPDSIIYTNVSGDQFDGDFIAVKVGDISGNADPGNAPPGAITADFASSYFLEIEDRYFEEGEIFELKIPVPNLPGVVGFQSELKFSEEAFSILNVEKIMATGGELLQVSKQGMEDGRIAFNWIDSGNGIAPDDFLLSIELQANKGGLLSEYIRINKEVIKSELYSGSASNSWRHQEIDIRFLSTLNSLEFNENAPNIQISPNPTENNLFIFSDTDFPLDEAHIELFHLSGRSIKVLSSGNKAIQGANMQFSIADFPAGIYFLQVTPKKSKPQIIKVIKN